MKATSTASIDILNITWFNGSNMNSHNIAADAGLLLRKLQAMIRFSWPELEKHPECGLLGRITAREVLKPVVNNFIYVKHGE
jgi:hypothetical protein